MFLSYQPTPDADPTFTARLSPSAEIFSRHQAETNFGENTRFDTQYTYLHSSSLKLVFRDRFRRRGQSRTANAFSLDAAGTEGLADFGEQGGLDQVEGEGVTESSLSEGDLISRGDRIENGFVAFSRYDYSENISLSGRYELDYTAFLDAGGTERSQAFEVEGLYRKWREHNLRVRYKITFLKFRSGKSSVLHDVNIGDDFFSTQKIQLTPTLTLLASVGLALQTGQNFRVKNRLNLTAIKVWRRAALSLGVDRDLRGTGGLSGPSFTTSFFTSGHFQLTRRLTALVDADFSMFETEDTDFKTFQLLSGFRYWFTRWLSSSIMYSYRRLSPDSGTVPRGLPSRSTVSSNSVFVMFTAYVDWWPNTGLAREVQDFSLR